MATDKISGFDVVDNFVDEIGAAEYVDADNYSLSELLAYADNTGKKSFVFRLNYNANINPTSDRVIGIGTSELLFCFARNGSIYYCYNAEEGWVGDKYLPLSGGTLNGNIELTDAKHFISTDGTNKLEMFEYDNVGYLRHIDSESKRRAFMLFPKSKAELPVSCKLETNESGSSSSYNIFGEHNKPTGSYTGNGNTANRKIATGGIGDAVLVISNNGIAFVWSSGAQLTNTSGTTSFTDRANFTVAKGISLDTDNAVLNANGVSYKYYVL